MGSTSSSVSMRSTRPAASAALRHPPSSKYALAERPLLGCGSSVERAHALHVIVVLTDVAYRTNIWVVGSRFEHVDVCCLLVYGEGMLLLTDVRALSVCRDDFQMILAHFACIHDNTSMCLYNNICGVWS